MLAAIVVNQIYLLFEGSKYFILENLVILKRGSRFIMIVVFTIHFQRLGILYLKGHPFTVYGGHRIQQNIGVL